jgi:hypothetical protein
MRHGGSGCTRDLNLQSGSQAGPPRSVNNKKNSILCKSFFSKHIGLILARGVDFFFTPSVIYSSGGVRENLRGIHLPCECVDFYFEGVNIIKI